jgi:hypothetical protein
MNLHTKPSAEHYICSAIWNTVEAEELIPKQETEQVFPFKFPTNFFKT